ncbi:MAG: hypothetical protein ACE5MK_11310 [Acidobacteriota bacterium]
MKALFPLLAAVALASASWLAAAREQQQEEQQEPTQQQEQEPFKLPRIVGQAKTQEEMDAWNAVLGALSPQEKIQLGKNFLELYPESGLTSYVHKEMALSYFQTNDNENFINHAEEALQELPTDPAILPTLARAYAERGDNNKAIEKAQKGMEVFQTLEKPMGAPLGQWRFQIDRAKADLNYAEGLALLRKALEMVGDSTALLKRSVDRFQVAADLDPSFDAAYFRLGFAYAKLNDADKAIENYARTAALDSLASGMAREQLQRIYTLLQKDTLGIEQVIEEQREYVQKKIAENEAQIEELDNQEQIEQERPMLPQPPQPPR